MAEVSSPELSLPKPKKPEERHIKLPSIKAVARTVVAGGALAAAAAGARFALDKSGGGSDEAVMPPAAARNINPDQAQGPAVVSTTEQKTNTSEQTQNSASANKEAWVPAELKSPLTSYSQLKSVVESFPAVEGSDDFKVKTKVIDRINLYAEYEGYVNSFVKAYFDAKDPDGMPILRRLEKTKLLKLDLSPLIAGDSHYSSVDDFLDRQFFFNQDNYYLKLGLTALTNQMNYISKNKVSGRQALDNIRQNVFSSPFEHAINDGHYALAPDLVKGQITWDVSAVSGVSQRGRTIQQDEAIITQALSKAPSIGNVTIKLVDDLKTTPDAFNPTGDQEGRYMGLTADKKGVVIEINRNTSSDLGLIALHEKDGHGTDPALSGPYPSLVSTLRDFNKVIAYWIARDEAVIAMNTAPDGSMTSPYTLGNPELPYVIGDKVALSKLPPEVVKAQTQKIFDALTEDDEQFAGRFSAFLSGDFRGMMTSLEKSKYQKCLDLLIAFLSPN